MTAQLLFYANAVPVSRHRHAGCSVEAKDFGFCRGVNSVPLMAVEFPSAVGEYPIVFAGQGDAIHPVVVLGLRADENLYVSGGGAWLGRYIPAFVRRYPFVFSAGEDGKGFVLCVDEAFSGFNRDGRGERLFGEDGEPTPYVARVLRFLQEYRAQFVRTQAFCRTLHEAGLLEPMQARVPFGEAQIALRGFSVVSRQRLKALAGDRLSGLVRSDELELVFLHLQSLRNFESVRGRLPLVMPTAYREFPPGLHAVQPQP